MLNEDKLKKLNKEKCLFNNILWIPMIILLAVVPLIVRVTITNPEMLQISTLRLEKTIDFYSQGKASFLLIMTGIIIIAALFLFKKEWIKKDKKMGVYIGATLLFAGMSLLAALLSEHKSTAWWGIYDRAEGMVTLACYVLIMLYVIYIYNEESHMKYVLGALSVMVGIMTILGVFQYWGHDLIYSEWFQKLIMPGSYSEYVLQMAPPAYDKGKIYGTIYHSNYMGSFGVMMLALFAGETLFEKRIGAKLFLCLITLCSAFLLFGSTSRAGLVGFGAVCLMALIILGKQLIYRWKFVIPIVLGGLFFIGGLNVVTKGAIFERVPTLINDAFGLFGKSDPDFDYKAVLPIQDIKVKDKTAAIILKEDELIIEYTHDQIVFKDEKGEQIEYTNNGNRLTTTDERFKSLNFELRQGDANGDGIEDEILVLYLDATDLFVFKYDNDQGVYLVNSYTLKKEDILYPETFGFKGKERLGSARGYIWSRSIPMLKKTWLIGHGPDTYPLYFPQADAFGKWWAYDTPKMTVDKPHNMYLQYGINNGGIALLAFLTLVGSYIVNSIRLYAFKKDYTSEEGKGIAVLLAVVGYLGAGLFNDSVVSVAPIFWVLLGLGIAINYRNGRANTVC